MRIREQIAGVLRRPKLPVFHEHRLPRHAPGVFYLIGLPFAAVDLLLVYAFYARKDTLTPALVGILSLVCYLAAALLLFERYGLFSLMIADSVKHFVHASISGVLLWRRLGGFGNQRLARTGVKAALASLIMAGFALVSLPLLTEWIGTASLLRELALVGLSALLYGGVFLLAARMLKIAELSWLLKLLRERLRS